MVFMYCKSLLFPFKQLLEISGWVCHFPGSVESHVLSSTSLCCVAMKLPVAGHTASQREHSLALFNIRFKTEKFVV
jgi:hypothetical protein